MYAWRDGTNPELAGRPAGTPKPSSTPVAIKEEDLEMRTIRYLLESIDHSSIPRVVLNAPDPQMRALLARTYVPKVNRQAA